MDVLNAGESVLYRQTDRPLAVGLNVPWMTGLRVNTRSDA